MLDETDKEVESEHLPDYIIYGTTLIKCNINITLRKCSLPSVSSMRPCTSFIKFASGASITGSFVWVRQQYMTDDFSQMKYDINMKKI